MHYDLVRSLNKDAAWMVMDTDPPPGQLAPDNCPKVPVKCGR